MRKKCRITIKFYQILRLNICFDRDFCFGNVTDDPEDARESRLGANKTREQNEQKQRNNEKIKEISRDSMINWKFKRK